MVPRLTSCTIPEQVLPLGCPAPIWLSDDAVRVLMFVTVLVTGEAGAKSA